MYTIELIAPTASETSLTTALRAVAGVKVRKEGDDTRNSVLTVSFSELDTLDALHAWWTEQSNKNLTMITGRGRWQVQLKRHSPDELKTIVEEDTQLSSAHIPHLGEAT
jgi:hypothetical protein